MGKVIKKRRQEARSLMDRIGYRWEVSFRIHPLLEESKDQYLFIYYASLNGARPVDIASYLNQNLSSVFIVIRRAVEVHEKYRGLIDTIFQYVDDNKLVDDVFVRLINCSRYGGDMGVRFTSARMADDNGMRKAFWAKECYKFFADNILPVRIVQDFFGEDRRKMTILVGQPKCKIFKVHYNGMCKRRAIEDAVIREFPKEQAVQEDDY